MEIKSSTITEKRTKNRQGEGRRGKKKAKRRKEKIETEGKRRETVYRAGERERRITKRPFASKSEELYSNASVPLAQGEASETQRYGVAEQVREKKRTYVKEKEKDTERKRERGKMIERTARSGGGRRGRITMRGYKRRRISV